MNLNLATEPLETKRSGALASNDGSGGSASPPASTTPATAAVLLLATATRVAVARYVVAHYATGWLYTRGIEMGLLATSLLRGEGLSSPFGPPTGPTAIVAPGYALLVAGIFRLLGSYTRSSALFILGIQIALNVLTVWFILRLSRRFASERAALSAGTVWAVSPPLLWMPTIFWDTSISCFLVLLFTDTALKIFERSRSSLWVLLGACAGAAGLVNPALLPSFAAVSLWLSFRTRLRQRRWPMVGLLTFVLIFSPWPMRNARVFHAWIPTRTTVGLELWMGNRTGAQGYLDTSIFPAFNAAELSQYRALGEIGYMTGKQQMAISDIRQQPLAFVRLTLRRVARFWFGSGTQNGSLFFVLHASLTTLVGLLGLIALRSSPDRRLLPLFWLPLAIFPLPYFITHAEFRYRLVLDPLLAVLMARGLERMVQRTAERTRQS